MAKPPLQSLSCLDFFAFLNSFFDCLLLRQTCGTGESKGFAQLTPGKILVPEVEAWHETILITSGVSLSDSLGITWGITLDSSSSSEAITSLSTCSSSLLEGITWTSLFFSSDVLEEESESDEPLDDQLWSKLHFCKCFSMCQWLG